MPQLIQRQEEEKEPEETPSMPMRIQRACAGCEAEDKIQTKRDFPDIPTMEEQTPEATDESETELAGEEEAVPESGGETAGAEKKGDAAAKISLPEIEPYTPEEEAPLCKPSSLRPPQANLITEGPTPTISRALFVKAKAAAVR